MIVTYINKLTGEYQIIFDAVSLDNAIARFWTTSKSFDRIILHCGYTSNIRLYNRISPYKAEIAKIDKRDWLRYSQEFIKDGYEPNKKYFRFELFF